MSVGTLRSRETRKEKPMASKQMNWRFLPVLAALAACVPPPVAAQTVVKIGVVNSFSGFLAGPGDEMQKGIDWPRNKAIDWHHRRVPRFHRLIADRVFKARDLPRLHHVLGTVINRTASAGAVMRWLHPLIMRRESKLGTRNEKPGARPG